MEDIVWKNLEGVLERFSDAFINAARDNLDKDDSNASYDLYNSFEKIIEIGEDSFSVKISLEDYWKYVNDGRGPGKFPPPSVIENWIEVKPVEIYPLSNGKLPSVKQVGFLIGRKIANEGTQGTHFFDQAKEETIRAFERQIDEAISRDVDEWLDAVITRKMGEALA